MEENGNNTDIRTRYEYLIAGLMVLLLCICAFAVYRVTNYIRVGSRTDEQPVSSVEGSDGAVLIEVEITQGSDEDDQSISDAVEAGDDRGYHQQDGDDGEGLHDAVEVVADDR